MRVGATALRASSACVCESVYVSACVRVDARLHVRVSERESEGEMRRETTDVQRSSPMPKDASVS